MLLLPLLPQLLVAVWFADAARLALDLGAKACQRSATCRATGDWAAQRLQRKSAAVAQAAISMLLFVALCVYSTSVAYSAPRVIELDIPLARLPACMDGYKIAFLADVHAGAMVGAEATKVSRWYGEPYQSHTKNIYEMFSYLELRIFKTAPGHH